MDMTMRAMNPAERNYCYAQSQQISMQTGLIGHLRADMDSSGTGFFSSFFNFRADLKTEDFKTEFDAVINALRFDESYGGILKDRSALSSYCHGIPESSFGGDGREFGFRVDTKQYSYMLRLNPNRGEYNLYCYCYQKKWLDRHLQQAERGIRFINLHYKELFRIPDGDKIRIIHSDGEKTDYTCRYIDDYHVEIGSGWNSLLHICQFAEIMEHNGSTVIPLRSSLPEQCYSVLPDTGELIIIKKGESGYYRTDIDMGDKTENRVLADEYNTKLGVSKAQEQAMSAGSMFGWSVPAAAPKNYDDNGQPTRSKNKDWGDAR
jgi:hypothetical protein